ncbi:MAG: tripartite tricarboxylate transporter permease [Paracoccaceae bacterium]|nr:tripartite tricarboxylate transporter permease [Paracoccaceae bacterium]
MRRETPTGGFTLVLDAAMDALLILLDPMRLMFVAFGTLLGLMIGVIPGIGGLVGLSLLLPFTFTMDPYTALAFLVGVQAVTTTSDTIPAVLFGVPGTSGSAATVLDGHPMARKGEAGRAYGAAFTASVFGGLFGALILAISIPVMQPLIMAVGTPEMLATCLLGLTLVVTLSHGALFKGLVAAALGLLLSTIGDEAQTGEMRWTFDTYYLWDGLSLVAVALGLFAVPEMLDLGASKKSVSSSGAKADPWQQLQGAKDVVKNWWLVIRCASIGTLLGAIPGIGANVIDWIAYGFAAKVTKGSNETFGKGDVRGVIASESANNAKEGGALMPTLVFGIPGSASMAILLGAFLIHGIKPGPDMLGPKLDVTFTLVWTVALANILGAGVCILLAGQFAKLATVRAGFLVPLVFSVMVIGAYQGSKSFGDLIVLIAFGLLGWVMKRLGWPRPPLILAFVLGKLIENYLFISHLRYGVDWMLRPVPAILLSLMVFMLFSPLIRRFLPTKKSAGGSASSAAPVAKPAHNSQGEFWADMALWGVMIGLFVYVLSSSNGWDLPAKMMPQALALAGLLASAGFFVLFAMKKIPPILVGDHEPLSKVGRQWIWLLSLVVAIKLIGMVPAIMAFAAAYMLREGKAKPATTAMVLVPFLVALYVLFEHTLHVPWPASVLGDIFPDLRKLTGRML